MVVIGVGDRVVIVKAGEVGGRIKGGKMELIGDANDICSVIGIFGLFGVWIWWHDDDGVVVEDL